METVLNDWELDESLDRLIADELEGDDLLIREIFKQSSVNMFVTSEDRRIVFASGAFCKMLGFPLGELNGKNLKMVMKDGFSEEAHIELFQGSGFSSSIEEVTSRFGECTKVLLYTNAMRELGHTYLISIVIRSESELRF
jgi:PAS domain S-box-containing protein